MKSDSYIFDKEKMLDKGIIMEDIYLSIMNEYNNDIKFVYSDQNSKELIGRISIHKNMKGYYDGINNVYSQTEIIPIFKKYEENLLYQSRRR